MFGTTSGTRSTFFSFVVKWNSNGTGMKTVTSTGPFLHCNLQFQWKLHLWAVVLKNINQKIEMGKIKIKTWEKSQKFEFGIQDIDSEPPHPLYL